MTMMWPFLPATLVILARPRNMTDCVAHAFCKAFRRLVPSCSTIQEYKKRTTVYGVVTKPIVMGKPNIADYDIAYRKLIEEFKLKKYKRHVCSPIWCIRNLIPLQNVVKNVIQFYHINGRPVTINQESAGILRNSLIYDV